MSPRILAICGSARRDSMNRRLLSLAIAHARSLGAEVSDLPIAPTFLPIYDGDLEAAEGLPQGARDLKEAFAAHDGFLIASPEYNGFFTPLLKNAIDWVSRPAPGMASPFAGKAAALLAASAGSLGGIRGLPHLRLLLSNLGVTVAPGQMALAGADTAFDQQGRLSNPMHRSMLEGTVSGLLALSAALKGRA